MSIKTSEILFSSTSGAVSLDHRVADADDSNHKLSGNEHLALKVTEAFGVAIMPSERFANAGVSIPKESVVLLLDRVLSPRAISSDQPSAAR